MALAPDNLLPRVMAPFRPSGESLDRLTLDHAGASYYMFSDGFNDQIGGERGRGFGKRRLPNTKAMKYVATISAWLALDCNLIGDRVCNGSRLCKNT
jgi:hypothetical protein